MNEQWRELLEMLSRLRGVRFSLATCALLVLFLGSVVAAWVNRDPWVMVRSTPLPDFRSPEDPHLTLLSPEGSVLVHRPRNESRLAVWNWHTGALEPVEFPQTEILLDCAPNGRFLTADKKKTARVRQFGLQFPLVELTDWVHPTAQNLRLSADGNRIAASGPDGAVWIYDIPSQKETSIPALSTAPEKVHLEFSGDGRWLQAFEQITIRTTNPVQKKFVAWQLIDCDRHVRTEVPAEIQAGIEAYGPYHCTFAGSAERLFLYSEIWRIGAPRFEPAPGIPMTPTHSGRAQALGFLKDREHIEVWSEDLTKQVGRITVPVLHQVYDEGPYLFRLSETGRQLTYCSATNDGPATFLWDTPTGKLSYTFPDPLQVEKFLGPNHLLCVERVKGELQVWWRRRPEAAWGVLGQPEVWLALVFFIGVVFSIRRDRRAARAAGT